MNYVAELKLWLTNVVELTLDNATIQVEKQVNMTQEHRSQRMPGKGFIRVTEGFAVGRSLRQYQKRDRARALGAKPSPRIFERRFSDE